MSFNRFQVVIKGTLFLQRNCLKKQGVLRKNPSEKALDERH